MCLWLHRLVLKAFQTISRTPGWRMTRCLSLMSSFKYATLAIYVSLKQLNNLFCHISSEVVNYIFSDHRFMWTKMTFLFLGENVCCAITAATCSALWVLVNLLRWVIFYFNASCIHHNILCMYICVYGEREIQCIQYIYSIFLNINISLLWRLKGFLLFFNCFKGAGIQSGDWRGFIAWKYQWTRWNRSQLRPGLKCTLVYMLSYAAQMSNQTYLRIQASAILKIAKLIWRFNGGFFNPWNIINDSQYILNRSQLMEPVPNRLWYLK